MTILPLLLLAAPASPASVVVFRNDDFKAAIRSASADYDPILKSNVALLDDGRVEEATKKLLDLVPEAKRDAAHWFVLGNLLFEQDFALSFGLHQKAFELAPKEAEVAFEWAIERQRKGEWADAEKIHAALADGDGSHDPAGGGLMSGNRQLHALRSECLLRLGRVADAVASWKRGVEGGEHGPIEEAFHWVHGRPNPWIRRAPLLAKAKAGDADAATELWVLDLSWDIDWWNTRPKKAYVERDRSIVQEAVGAETPDGKALELLAKYVLDRGPDAFTDKRGLDATPFVADAKAAGFLGDAPHLPKSSRVATNLMRIAIDRQAATAADLHGLFGVELRKRIDAGDALALEIACALAQDAAPDEIGALEQLGWDQFADAACVGGILGRRGIPTLERDDPLVVAALAKHGEDDERIAMIGLALAQRDQVGIVEAATRLALADMRRLASVHSVVPVFKLLEKELAKPAAK